MAEGSYRQPYSFKEVAGCLYVARYGESMTVNIRLIAQIAPRSETSVKMKVENIVSQLHERGISVHGSFPPLTGKTTGEDGRLTNWKWIRPMVITGPKELEDLFASL